MHRYLEYNDVSILDNVNTQLNTTYNIVSSVIFRHFNAEMLHIIHLITLCCVSILLLPLNTPVDLMNTLTILCDSCFK